jgi:hypothetical protein
LGSLGDKVHLEGVTAGGDAVSSRVVGSVQSAVGSAGSSVWAGGCVPGVTSVAVGVSADSVKPSPVGINHNGCGRRRTSRGSTLADGERRVSLSGAGAGLLGAGSKEERGEGKN